jgi:hypothetical protein
MPAAGNGLPAGTQVELMSICDPACRTCLLSERSQGVAMDANDRLQELIRLSFSALRDLPETSSQNVVDEDGKKYQLTIWRELTGPESCRVLVSLHRKYVLGGSSLRSAQGFSMSSNGTIELLDPSEAQQLFS